MNTRERWSKILIIVGLWYLAIPVMVLARSNPSRSTFPVAVIAVGALGLVIIGGCIWRLRRHSVAA